MRFPFFYRNEEVPDSLLKSNTIVADKIDELTRKTFRSTEEVHFLFLLERKRQLFIEQINNSEISDSLKNEYKRAYLLFSDTLKKSFEQKNDLRFDYMHHEDYIPVGRLGAKQRLDDIAIDCIITAGSLLLAASIVAFVFNPVIGAGVLSFALLAMAPFVAWTFLETVPKEWASRSDDAELFDALSKVYFQKPQEQTDNKEQLGLDCTNHG